MKLLTFLCVLAVRVTGEFAVICPTRPIEAEEGDDVTLQCHLDPPVNVVKYTVDWKRVDLYKDVVHAYRHGQDLLQDQMDQYRDRTTLIREDLSRGILTLLVSSVQMSDSGLYACFVPKWWASCTMNLTVVERNQNKTKRDPRSTTRPPLEEMIKPDSRDGANRKSGRAGVILTAIIVFFVFLALVLKSRTIQDCMKRLRGGTDTLDIEAADRDEDLESPAGNGLGIIV